MRYVLAGPFALSLALALVLGPTTIDSAHGSFLWLVGASLAAAILIFTLRGGWLAGAAVLTLLDGESIHGRLTAGTPVGGQPRSV